jgi:hypothetical protein
VCPLTSKTEDRSDASNWFFIQRLGVLYSTIGKTTTRGMSYIGTRALTRVDRRGRAARGRQWSGGRDIG